jgi:hypothetical protein
MHHRRSGNETTNRSNHALAMDDSATVAAADYGRLLLTELYTSTVGLP